jgi:hypothetical protein
MTPWAATGTSSPVTGTAAPTPEGGRGGTPEEARDRGAPEGRMASDGGAVLSIVRREKGKGKLPGGLSQNFSATKVERWEDYNAKLL